jgi:2'-5' RNA ligase
MTEIESVGAFYVKKFPSILFLKLSAPTILNQMVKDIETHTEILGFRKEKRAFKAHITLARIKYIKDTERFNRLIKQDHNLKHGFSVTSFELYESRLHKYGPEYSSLESFCFPA